MDAMSRLQARLAAAGGAFTFNPGFDVDWSRFDTGFLETKTGEPLIAGAFGANRSASSMYHPYVQEISGRVLRALEAELGLPRGSLKWWPDAFAHRTGKIAAEDPHRDMGPDFVFASWIASTRSQFCFKPGSATQQGAEAGGMVRVSESSGFVTLHVPAGFVIVLDPRVLHKTAAWDYRNGQEQMRLFIAINTGLVPADLFSAMLNGLYPGAPSGSKQTTFPKLWLANNPHLAIEAAAKLRDYSVTTAVVKPGAAESTRRKIAAGLGVDSVAAGDTYPVPKLVPQPIPREIFAEMGDRVEQGLRLIGVDDDVDFCMRGWNLAWGTHGSGEPSRDGSDDDAARPAKHPRLE